MAKNTICLWYDKDAEAAARFYAETFPNRPSVSARLSISKSTREKARRTATWRTALRLRFMTA
jgi:predicted 3-demethylubiquinone-9 3-methyltransferase (glyoxalase superfamily)